jgi:TonB family protein
MSLFAVRGESKGLRSAMSFATSACVHGGVLLWVAFGGGPPAKPPQSLYDQEIRPYEKKIVWYKLADKLPEIAPPEPSADPRPLRARVQAPHTMVAGAKDDPNPGPMIWTPEPPPLVKPPEPPKVELPNVVAVAPAKIVRPFVAAPDVRAPELTAKLPEPPRVESKVDAAPLPFEVKGAKPVPRAFVPPPQLRMERQAAILLPEAPEARATVVEPNALPFEPGGARPHPRDFVPPPAAPRSAAVAALPVAPEVASRAAALDAKVSLPRGFVVPPARPMDRSVPAVGTEAPAVNAAATPQAETTMAIVGLNPANTREIPRPPESRPAGFSAGPVERKDGASGANNGITLLNVPGLTVRSGVKDADPTMVAPPFSPTSRENLMAAARVPGGAPTVTRTPSGASAPRVTEAPDPRLSGRVIYSIAIQMPNVTSYSGSWVVWFAEREPLPGLQKVDMQAPVPLRKVDPKYVASAAADRVEGIIRLAALIRKDGHVEQISLIHHLDERLDRTAQEALAKWEFTPAMRDGVPVDVDAVFEIPFRLAPRPGK